MKSKSLLLTALVCATPAVAAAQGVPSEPSAVAGLSTLQRTALERGEPVQVLFPVAESPWPRSVVYQFIDASPEECAAMLADYERYPTYLPRTKATRILGRRGGGETDVLYVVSVPLFSDERSVSRETVRVNAKVYEVRWTTVLSDTTPHGSVTTGRATFVAMTNSATSHAGSLMTHDQLVVPSSIFARVPFVRTKAIETSRDIAVAIARQTELERRGDTGLLARQVSALRAMLASRPDSENLSRQP